MLYFCYYFPSSVLSEILCMTYHMSPMMKLWCENDDVISVWKLCSVDLRPIKNNNKNIIDHSRTINSLEASNKMVRNHTAISCFMMMIKSVHHCRGVNYLAAFTVEWSGWLGVCPSGLYQLEIKHIMTGLPFPSLLTHYPREDLNIFLISKLILKIYG